MRWHIYAFAFILTITLVTPNNSQAQTNTQPSIFIEEIVVTATKRATTLQDAPISISVISVEQMDQLAISDVLDLQSSVPSLKIAQQQFANQNTFLIRGFGNGANNPGVEPAVAISIDGVMISRNQSALNDLISVERIEVIKGPQSTLFGKNSSAGVISITTKLPEQEFGGKLEITAGDYGLKKLRGTVTGPLTEKTSFRLSASTTERDGFVDNLFLGTKINNRDRQSIRGQLLSEISENVTLRIIANYDKSDENCCTTAGVSNGAATLGGAFFIGGALGKQVIVNPVDPYGYTTYLNNDPTGEFEGKGLSAHIDWELDAMSFKSITSFRENSQKVFGDVDFSAMPLLTNSIDDEFETFTQEFRLSSNNDGPFQWMIGAYYQDEKVKHDRDVLYKENISTLVDIILSAVPTSLDQISGGVAIGALSQISALPAAVQMSLLGTALPPLTTTQIGGVLAGVSTGSPALDGGIAAIIPGLAAQQRAGWYGLNSGLQHEYFDVDNEAFSLFANFDIDVSDNTTVSLGVSYSKDEKTVVSNVIIDDAFAEIPFALDPSTALLAGFQFFPPFYNYPNATEDGKWDSDDITHSFKVIHQLDDDLSIYFSHSTGFKAISVNLSANATVYSGLPMNNSIYYADPEEAENIEVGFRKSFSNGYLNVTLFDMTVDNIQSNLFVGTGFNLVNVSEQRHKGIEVDSMFYLNQDLVVTFNASLIDAKYGSFTNGPCDSTRSAPASDDCPVIDGSLARYKDFTGQVPGGVPDLAITVSAAYTFDVSMAFTGFVRAEYVYEDKIQATDNVPTSLAPREVGTINASFGLQNEDSGWNLLIWGRNINDDEYVQTAFGVPGSPGSFAIYPNQPKMMGITLGKQF
jgi:iron complex outermembrane receptor protein